MAKRSSGKQRIDRLVVERQLASSRTEAQRLVMAGLVTVNGQLVTKPGTQVPTQARIDIAQRFPYVSRGGLKLEAALDAFGLRVKGLVAADVGASTGGFTDCLLQQGARRVYAIDVGYGQLAWALRQDERVVVMERTNARHLEQLPEPIDLGTVDVSFISLTLILPRIRDWLRPEGAVVALIKPQFEAGRSQVGKGGVVRDPETHLQVLQRILTWAPQNGLSPTGLIRSPIVGPAGNVEFLALLHRQPPTLTFEVGFAIEAVLQDPG
jgi:23S rRNA (cytidine1920-2'-O)/16S rRNA (cytidine1409-2'-O)-methyltransferase